MPLVNYGWKWVLGCCSKARRGWKDLLGLNSSPLSPAHVGSSWSIRTLKQQSGLGSGPAFLGNTEHILGTVRGQESAQWGWLVGLTRG